MMMSCGGCTLQKTLILICMSLQRYKPRVLDRCVTVEMNLCSNRRKDNTQTDKLRQKQHLPKNKGVFVF